MNIVENYTKLLIEKLCKFTNLEQSFPYGFGYSLDDFNCDVESFSLRIIPILTKEDIDFHMITTDLMFFDMPIKQCVEEVLMNTNVTKDDVENILEEHEMNDVVSLRDRIFDINEEDYLLWRMSI